MQPLPDYVRHLHYTCRDKKVVKESISSQSRRPHKIRQPMVLKQLAQRIAPILQVIYKVSLRDWSSLGDWSRDWSEDLRLAKITPLFKKGDKDCAVNYRPISLTCIFSKLLEHIITSNITHHLGEHSILYHLQHGFRSGRSCETQLLELTTNSILKSGCP